MIRQPKILFLTRSLEIGGAERQIIELGAGLHRTGWQVRVATFYGGGALEARLREAGLDTVCLEKGGRWDVFSFGWRLIKLLREERPDIVHGYLDVPNILLAVLRSVVPGSRVVWGVRASNMEVGATDTLYRMETMLGVLLSRSPDLIICNSQAGRDYHAARGFFSGRMVVVPNGIDIHRFSPDAQARRDVRAEWGIGESERLIGLVARLDLMKDHPNFLRAAAQVAASDPSARFVCVGDGPASYRDELAESAGKLGLADRLIWAGARVDVWRVYNALDVAVSSSSFGEGFSNTVAEAMATGIPCVVTDVGDSAALVGPLGRVCPPNDSAALARAIADTLRSLPADPAPIRQRIVANYSSGALLERTGEHLSKLLAPNLVPSIAGK